MQIDQLTFRVSEAARITGLPIGTVRTWMDRHGLFPEMRDIGRGHHVQLRIPHLLMLGAVDALSSTGLTVTAASDIVRNSGAWPFGFDAQWLYATKNEDGRWIGMASPDAEVTIICNLATTWKRISPEIVKIIHERAADGVIDAVMASQLADARLFR